MLGTDPMQEWRFGGAVHGLVKPGHDKIGNLRGGLVREVIPDSIQIGACGFGKDDACARHAKLKSAHDVETVPRPAQEFV